MQYGIIEISKEIYENDYETVLEVFKKLKPYKIDYLVQEEIFEISGVCKEFDDIEEGDLIPLYSCNVTLIDGKKEISFCNPEI